MHFSATFDTWAALDRVIHEQMRLRMLSALATYGRLTFSDLKQLLQASDGNLSVHARKLDSAGYVSCRKRFHGRIPRTDYEITRAGRQALEQYFTQLEALIEAARTL